MQDEEVSRYEVNRSVRMVLSRHDADLERIDYSYVGHSVYLYGDLIKPGGDFSVQGVEALAREISALPHVREIQFHLNNWKVNSSGDSWQITKARKPVAGIWAPQHVGSWEDSDIIIEKAEKLTDVLTEIKEDSKKDKESEKKARDSTQPK